MGLAIPVIVRLEGTNVDEGKKILRESGLKITPAEGLADAAKKAVEATR
jgi:succinyl-CoA synthetase beta subunit